MTQSGPENGQDVVAADRSNRLWARHLGRVVVLMTVASALLGWLAAHTDVFFADGLRYITQARSLEQGSAHEGVKKAVDHPVYPLAVAAVHRALGGTSPESWQYAAQLASIIAGVLLVIPLYLLYRELFGDACAFPACLLVYAIPLTGHVFADTLSESTFLLFWTWGLWAALVFLRTGGPGWIPAVVVFSGLAYLTRPEGLLLPAALATTVALSPRWVARGLGKKGMIALGVLVAGSVGVVGPYVALKGGIGTKPSIARLLGTTPKSAAHAVERQRPLEPDQTAAKTYTLAVRAVGNAVAEAVTFPLLALAAVGVLGLRRGAGAFRQWKILAVIWVASLLALVRLHATGGYCTPRHAMVLALLALPSAAAALKLGIDWAAAWLATRSRFPARPVGWAVGLGVVLLLNAAELFAPVGEGFDGYRDAGQWLARRAAAGEAGRVVDVTGWSQFYGGHEAGYTFENLVAAPADPDARWVVAREAHLKGPWEYCQRLRSLVDGLQPVEVFRGSARRRPTKVYVFDRRPLLARPDTPPTGAVRR